MDGRMLTTKDNHLITCFMRLELPVRLKNRILLDNKFQGISKFSREILMRPLLHLIIFLIMMVLKKLMDLSHLKIFKFITILMKITMNITINTYQKIKLGEQILMEFLTSYLNMKTVVNKYLLTLAQISQNHFNLVLNFFQNKKI